MNKNALAALTVLNTVGLLALAMVVLGTGDPAAKERVASASVSAAPAGEEPRRIAQLEQRLARLETHGDPAAQAIPPLDRPGPSSDAGPSVAPAPLAAPRSGGPVTRAEVETLVADALAKREAAQREQWRAASTRPKRPLNEVARELGLDARQESAVREQYRQLERDSMKLLFEVDDAGLETLKAQLAQAEHDPRLKEQLRERLSINWTKRQSDVGVLWVKVDARLREQLGPELLQRFYGFDAQLEQKEFPDLQQMFYPQPQPAQEKQ